MALLNSIVLLKFTLNERYVRGLCMFKKKSLKALVGRALLCGALAFSFAQPIFAERKLSSGVVLPEAPIGFGEKFARACAWTVGGAALGGILGSAQSVNALRGVKLGAFLGLILGGCTWNADSAESCLKLFNSLYSSFLLNPVLEKGISLSRLIEHSVMSETQSLWAFVRLEVLLSEAIHDLVTVLAFGKVLRESKLVRALGDAECEVLRSKISSLQGLLDLARARRDVILSHPSYVLQKEFYSRYLQNRELQHAGKHSAAFDDLLTEWSEQRMARPVGSGAFLSVPSFIAGASECGVCGLLVSQEARYVTRCACQHGKFFYHHKCIAKTLQRNRNECQKCGYPATVHSAFSDIEPVSPVNAPFGPEYMPQSHVQRPSPQRSRCTLCRGIILRKEAYKTSCMCPSSTYFYHHGCLKTHLAASHDCPMCHLANPVVHSDFDDGFVPEKPAPVYTPEPTAPVIDTLNTCALCDGKIPENKRYKTRCDCQSGRYHYHHLCITDTLKKSGNRCPKCARENVTVHSAF